MNKTNLQKGFTIPVAIALVVIVAAGAIYLSTKAGPSGQSDNATSTVTGATSTPSATKDTTTAGTKSTTGTTLTSKAPVVAGTPGQAYITSITSLSSDKKFYSGSGIVIKGRNLGVCNYPTTYVGCYIRVSVGGKDAAVVSGTADQTSLAVTLPPLDPGIYNVFLQYPSDKTKKQSNDFQITVTGTVKPTVAVTSPNGSETIKIGSDMSVGWKVAGPLPAKYWVLVTLGSDTGGLIKLTDSTSASSFSWTIPTRIQHRTTVADIAPGAYKVTVGLYDGPICFTSCAAGQVSTGKLIVQDESDTTFNIAAYNTNIY